LVDNPLEEEPPFAWSSEGETERGVDRLLVLLSEPRVAMMEGDDGGSGDRVK
jgi:hypothetical protein